MSPLAPLDRPPTEAELTDPSYRPRHRPVGRLSARPPQCRGLRIPNSGVDHSGCQGHVHRGSRSGFGVVRSRLADRSAQLGVAALAALLVALPGLPGPVVAVAGLWLLLGAPAMLWYPVACAIKVKVFFIWPIGSAASAPLVASTGTP